MSGHVVEMAEDVLETPSIGLRGKWLVAMKVQIVVGYLALAVGVPWVVWVSRSAIATESDRTSSERFTQADGRALADAERVAREKLYQSIDVRLDALDRDNARILAILERLEASFRNRGNQQ